MTPREWIGRNGWLIAAVWLVFLAFPLLSLWTNDHSLARRLVGTSLLVAYGAVYALGFRAQFRHEARTGQPSTWAPTEYEPGQDGHDGRGYFVALVALLVVLAAVVGIAALGAVSYVVAFAMFHFRWRTVGLVVAVAVVVNVIGALAVGEPGLIPEAVGIVAVTALPTALIRAGEQYEHERTELRTRLAISDERSRVARDVHDVLGHSLTVVILKAELAGRLLGPEEDRLAACRRELEQIRSVSRDALAEIRATVGGLRAAELREEVTMARTVLGDAGIRLTVTGDPLAVAEPLQPTLAWVVREAVTNIVRHADARACWIDARACWIDFGPAESGGARAAGADEQASPGEEVILRIADDGVGLNGTTEGNGLRGLRERLEQVGATLRTVPGDGTVLEVVR